MVGSKQPQPVFLTTEEAESHCRAGASVWKFASTDSGLDPDVVLVGIGAEITFEVIEAAAWLRQHIPSARIRVVNVTDLLVLEHEGDHPHALTSADFDALFTADRPIHFNYHGYPNELKGLLFGRPRLDRVSVEAYGEEGSTTTPLDMMIVNHVSRWHVAEAAVKGAAVRNEKVRVDMHEALSSIRHELKKTKEYIMANGKGRSELFLQEKGIRTDNAQIRPMRTILRTLRAVEVHKERSDMQTKVIPLEKVYLPENGGQRSGQADNHILTACSLRYRLDNLRAFH